MGEVTEIFVSLGQFRIHDLTCLWQHRHKFENVPTVVFFYLSFCAFETISEGRMVKDKAFGEKNLNPSYFDHATSSQV